VKVPLSVIVADPPYALTVPATPSRFWRVSFRVMYRILALIDPAVRAVWRRFGIGNVVELEVPGRRSGRSRRRLVGVLNVAGQWYIGHPNGDVGWTRDVRASEQATIRWPDGTAAEFAATLLAPGEERERAIRATWQHPFPGNVVYRLGRRQVRAVGVYFRLDPRH
jgi:hypothetical protein